jgi:mannose-6-phosphate isomerase-like protein (cupin superfamily)
MPDAAESYVQDPQAMRQVLQGKIKSAQPTFFKLEAQLPTQGRTDTPMAATEKQWVVLKTYAACGENELHAHPNEDHTFVVLQGRAVFYGPEGEEKVIGLHEGVLLPHGTFYWFRALGDEPLVMVRVGSAAFEGRDRFARINRDGQPMEGNSAENKEVELILSERWFPGENGAQVR